ncbi:gamma-aminobutyric acid type B receptor subunit 2-like [Orbicella faveolata]|uniref:gamma-aminobutyric acid type B receptor subunit 2-like n=1 Tax=Orbicella faveolata TaxID=48498 RepID=UPI0009E4B990|nr:gamma-aminobutyric acid type B receptor subunit 2-like [Orbicella faveolata]
MPVAAASHFWNLIQVGFSAASPRLSDKIRYPLFFRINAPETILNKAIVTLLRRFGWKQIAIVKQDEDLFNDVEVPRGSPWGRESLEFCPNADIIWIDGVEKTKTEEFFSKLRKNIRSSKKSFGGFHCN